jgi:hypothetical protein
MATRKRLRGEGQVAAVVISPGRLDVRPDRAVVVEDALAGVTAEPVPGFPFGLP